MIIGYARVSTKGQANDGNSLEAQEKELIARGASKVYKEAFTGTTMDRPVLNEVLGTLSEGDTLMFCKLDRVARTADDGNRFVNELLGKGIYVHILNMGLMDNTPNGQLMRHIFLAFAEFERAMIVERTQAGKAIAKQKEGFKEGRPKIKYPKEQVDMIKTLLDKDVSINKISKTFKIPYSSCKRLIEEIKEGKI